MLLGTAKEKIFIFLSFLVSNISCSIFQIFLLVILGGIHFFVWFFSGQVIWGISGDGKIASDTSTTIAYTTVAIIYGIVWLVFWRILYKGGIKWFYYRIIFSIIPLLVVLMMFDPNPNPMAMIPMATEPIFSSLATGIILLPVYSVLIYKFILQSPINKFRNTIFVCLVTLLIGSIIFNVSWNMMHVIYNYFQYKPLLHI